MPRNTMKEEAISLCSDIEQELLNLMFEDNSDDMCPEDYLATYFEVIYTSVYECEEPESPAELEYKNLVIELTHKHVRFDYISECLRKQQK